MYRSFYHIAISLSFLILMSSCYRQNIMFKTDDYEMDASIEEEMKKAEKNYVLRPYDKISFNVETNDGEALIDPNFQLRREMGMQNQNMAQQAPPVFPLQSNGIVLLPLIGEIKLSGYTLFEVDSILREEYSKFYKDAYVNTQVENRRVFVFNSQSTQVVPINDDNINVIEVLALSGGVSNDAKAHNIRLIRGDLKNPYVEEIDLSTIQGMQKANLSVKNQDIIYVEPVRRPVREATRDIAPIISVATSVLTIFVILTR